MECIVCQGLRATLRCLQCQDCYCDLCWQAHRRQRTGAAHTAVPVNDTATRPATCLVHIDAPLRLFCSTCQQIFCDLCFPTSVHFRQNHHVTDVADATLSKLSDSDLDLMLKTFDDAASEVLTEAHAMSRLYFDLLSKLADDFRDMMMTLMARRDEISATIERECRGRRAQLSTQYNTLVAARSELMRAMQYDACRVQRHVRLQELMHSLRARGLVFAPVCRALMTCESMNLTIPVPTCHVGDIEPFQVVGQPVQFIIETTDPRSIAVMIYDQDDIVVPSTISVTVHSVTVTYTPVTFGPIAIDVMCNGQHTIHVATVRSSLPLSRDSRILTETTSLWLLQMFAPRRPRDMQLLHGGQGTLSAEQFFNIVAGVGPVMIVIRSTTKHVFGAVVYDTFRDMGRWIAGDKDNFLFGHAPGPVKLVASDKRTRGIFMSRDTGLSMGAGRDLQAFAGSNFCNPRTFISSTDDEIVVTDTLLAGQRHWQAEYVEIYAIR